MGNRLSGRRRARARGRREQVGGQGAGTSNETNLEASVHPGPVWLARAVRNGLRPDSALDVPCEAKASRAKRWRAVETACGREKTRMPTGPLVDALDLEG
ncbi:MAG TPA: hypothetical protein VMK12_00135 [Anaeromyxobacteraceae bacterium]|nr:hypothetical protein [Anaeromyxobacteraceae bacterium]